MLIVMEVVFPAWGHGNRSGLGWSSRSISSACQGMLGRGPDRMKRGCVRVSPMRADVMEVVASREGSYVDASASLTHLSLSLSLSASGLEPDFGALWAPTHRFRVGLRRALGRGIDRCGVAHRPVGRAGKRCTERVAADFQRPATRTEHQRARPFNGSLGRGAWALRGNVHSRRAGTLKPTTGRYHTLREDEAPTEMEFRNQAQWVACGAFRVPLTLRRYTDM
jgi:hypothetical protein